MMATEIADGKLQILKRAVRVNAGRQTSAVFPVTPDGQITLSFTDARNGTLIWPGGSIPIQRFDGVIGSGNGITPSLVPENGWWWNEPESGRGDFMAFKNNFAFIAGYMYEASGPPAGRWAITRHRF